MSELTYFLLKMGFLALMWFFVFAVVYALRTDLFGPRVRVMKDRGRRRRHDRSAPVTAPQATPTVVPSAQIPEPPRHPTGPGLATRESAKRITVTTGPRAGHEFELTGEAVTIGRSLESDLVLRDDYTSSNHARIFLHGDSWMLEDQGSTNGTFLDGERVQSAVPVPLDAPIRIGTSTLELRR